MTTRPLHELDLASITVLPEDQQRAHLRRIGRIPPPYSLNAVRSAVPAIFNVTGGLLEVFAEVDRGAIEAAVVRKCSSDEDEIDANLRIARSLMDFSSLYRLVGRFEEFHGVALRIGWRLSYAFNLLVEVDGRPTAIWINPRTKRLSPASRAVVFSFMREQVRTISPDHADIRLLILEFKTSVGRAVRVVEANESALFSAEQLEQMAQITYRIWTDVQAERAAEELAKRKGPHSGKGTLI